MLVHGAWVGEWSWAPVLPLLESSGRPVYAVSLTGHGVRSHQSSADIRLHDHVDDVVAVLEVFGLDEVVLVGHSYGGRVISEVYARAAHRIAHLVYLDAHAPVVPDPGQTPERAAEAAANGGMLEFSGYDVDEREVGGPEGLAWFEDRIMPQSFETLNEPMDVRLGDDVRKTFVFATGYEPTRFRLYADVIRDAPDWEYHELDGSHWLMFSHPDEVASIIVG